MAHPRHHRRRSVASPQVGKGLAGFFHPLLRALPFIGFGLGFLQFGEAMFVFVLELVVYFLVFVLHLSFGVLTAGPGKILAH